MMIKSKSRKRPSFRQLVTYCEDGMSKGDEQYRYFHNLHPGHAEQIIRDFELNAEHLPERKNGVYLYHEILSFSRARKVSNERHKEILSEAIEEYLSKRAPDCMAYAVIHDEKENNVHAHIVISSNEIDSKKRHRITQRDYKTAKVHTEQYVNEKYPELEQGVIIDSYSKGKTKQSQYQTLKRGGRLTQQDKLHADLQVIFASARSEAELDRALALKGLGKSYRKGNKNSEPRFGKSDSKKHYRLKTLGLDTVYAQLLTTFEPEKSKTEENEKNKASLKKSTREKVQSKRSPAEPYPWSADAKKREKKAREPSIADRVKSTLKEGSQEWVSGDFSARDEKAKKEKYRKQNEADRKVKSRKEQKFHENLAETAGEWLGGDFSARDARARRAEFDKKVKDSKTVKDKGDQKLHERAKEKFDEFVKGDFSARDARSFKAKGEAKKTENAERQKKAGKEAQDAWFNENGVNEFVNEKVDVLDREEKERLIRAQARESEFKDMRSNQGKEREVTKKRELRPKR